MLAGEESGRQHLLDSWMVDRQPSVSYGPIQLEKRVEVEAPSSDPEKVGAGWVAVHRARSDQ